MICGMGVGFNIRGHTTILGDALAGGALVCTVHAVVDVHARLFGPDPLVVRVRVELGQLVAPAAPPGIAAARAGERADA